MQYFGGQSHMPRRAEALWRCSRIPAALRATVRHVRRALPILNQDTHARDLLRRISRRASGMCVSAGNVCQVTAANGVNFGESNHSICSREMREKAMLQRFRRRLTFIRGRRRFPGPCSRLRLSGRGLSLQIP
jgi:hypothetical protein